MQDDSSRNTIIFVVSAIALLFLYQHFVLDPAVKERQAAARAVAAAAPASAPGAPALVAQPKAVSRAQAAAASPRAPIANAALTGSVSLKGARIDDLYLNNYRQTLDRNAPPVELLRPEGAQHAWFAELGWTGANLAGLPTADTVWTLVEGSTLAPGKPLVLRHAGGQGLTFTRKIELDDKFMFTVTDTVANTGTAPVTVAPYGSIQRQGVPADLGKNQIVHEGGVGVLDGELHEFKYPKWLKEGGGSFASTGGWTGITDKYWLAAIIPSQREHIESKFRIIKAGGVDIYEANYLGAARSVPPGRQVTETTHLFAGAKVAPLLRTYQDKLGVEGLDRAVDWGFMWFLTRPMFTFLEYIFRHVGNFGVAILLLTVVVRLIFFPLANKQYKSITKMKKVQPQMEELKAKFKDDPQKQQQELMALYQREKVNPLAGCIPILFQIPVFYALYKVLTVTIEMRHAPFLGWIQDLSARDPTSIWTLFGLIPWHPASAPFVGQFLDGPLHLGVLPILYGVTMWLTTAMSPPAGDPIQQKIFQFMPLLFTFIMAPFAVGLLIYWTWSNVISIVQQYVIMRRFKVDNPIDQIIRKLTGKEAARVSDLGEPFDDEALEAARILFQRNAEFMMGAVQIAGLPAPDLPEVAFAGRSNVGKSSLINALVDRKRLARASNEPGRTREVNFFVLDETIRLVDLPGYGFARASRDSVAKFQNLGRDYLRGRPNLKRAYLLIDARHGLKDVDTEALDAFDTAAVSYQIVLTKADKLRPASELAKVVEATLKAIAKRPAAFPRVAATSAETGFGLPELRAEIAQACGVGS